MTTTTKRKFRPVAQELVKRQDGKYNFWHLMPFVEGYTETSANPVWVIRGVFNKVPVWYKGKVNG